MMHTTFKTILMATVALGFVATSPAFAADNTADALKALQEQVATLQKQLNHLQTQQKVQAKAQAQTEAKVNETSAKVAATPMSAPVDVKADGVSKEVLPGVKVTLGGYIEANGVWRDNTQMNDNASNFAPYVPFESDKNAHQNEFTGTARSSRLTLAMDGKVDQDMQMAAYIESDFLGAAVTSNSIQTNSYVPRLRQGFATLDHKGWGVKFLAGQAWSLATMNRVGITERKENGPMVIDVGAIPGYVHTRNTQFRIVKGFNENKLNAALSFEVPEVNLGGASVPTSAVLVQTTGVTPLNGGISYSTDVAPDIIAKLAADTSYGHYEIYGLTRFFHSLSPAPKFENDVEVGYGGGVSAFAPVMDKKLELYASFMAGKGVGRYSAALMPDLAFGANGSVTPVTEMSAWTGFVGHVTPKLSLYTYVGWERILRENDSANATYGYGSFGRNTAGCYTKGGTCEAQTKSTFQVTPGVWYQAYKGDYGNLKLGAQYSLTRRDAFSGSNGLAPHAFENIVMTSFKYAPF